MQRSAYRLIALVVVTGVLGAGCQGAHLVSALPASAVPSSAVPSSAVPPSEGPPSEGPVASATPEEFAAFLSTGGESRGGVLVDRDAAMATVLSKQARAQTPRRTGISTNACDQSDYLDTFANERGIGREHARLLYKNKKYKKPADAKK
jgi:hypothetical protein